MRRISLAVLAGVAAVALAVATVPAFGGFGGTITFGGVTFTRTASSFDSTPEASLTGVSVPGTQDHLFESGWAFRVAGDNHETFFGAPDSESYVDSASEIHWNDVGGRGLFSATESSQVGPQAGGGFVYHDMRIVNLSPSNALDVHLFHVVDIDLQPTAGDDLGALQQWTPNRVIGVEDSGSNFAAYLAFLPAAGFLARTNGPGDVAELLADAAITTFDNSGLPYGPGDLTAGYDFPFILPPSGNDNALVYVMINATGICNSPDGVFCDGFEIGNRSLWSSSVP